MQAIFLHPFDPSLFLFSVKKKTWSALEQLSCPFFHPTFNRPNPSAFTPALALQEGATATATVDPRLVAAFASEITKSLFVAYEAGRVNTAINDLWKFAKVMKSRYRAPNELGLSVHFTRDVGREMVELSNIELRNTTLRNDS